MVPVQPQVDEGPADEAHVREVLLVAPAGPLAAALHSEGEGLRDGIWVDAKQLSDF